MVEHEAVKEDFKVIKESDREYVLASDLPKYLKNRLNTSFGVPADRTIRYYVENGILDRPQRRGRETYFDAVKVINTLLILKELKPLNPSTDQMTTIIFNARKNDEIEVLRDFLAAYSEKLTISNGSKDSWFELLSIEKPSELKKKAENDLTIIFDFIYERSDDREKYYEAHKQCKRNSD